MTKIEIYAKANLSDAIKKNKWLDENINAYVTIDWWEGPELDDDWYVQKQQCFDRIINAMSILYPKRYHAKLLDKFFPNWKMFASAVPT